jgi:hypothetical protein
LLEMVLLFQITCNIVLAFFVFPCHSWAAYSDTFTLWPTFSNAVGMTNADRDWGFSLPGVDSSLGLLLLCADTAASSQHLKKYSYSFYTQSTYKK